MDRSVGFVTFRYTKQNRWPTTSHPGSHIKLFSVCYTCSTFLFSLLFLIPLPVSFCYPVNLFYIHQPSSKTSHTRYERETCISQNKCGIKYNWLLLNPPPPTHPYVPPTAPSYPTSSHPPTPPLVKLPPSTPDRAPVAKRQGEMDWGDIVDQFYRERERERGKEAGGGGGGEGREKVK